MGWFGLAFCLVAAATIAIAYLRRRGDLISTWHLFLVGSINFVGIAAMQSARDHYKLRNVATHHDFTDTVYLKFTLGAIVFFVTAYLVYYSIRWPRRLAANVFQNWPEINTATITTIGVICGIGAVCLAEIGRRDLSLISEIAGNLAGPLGVATVVLAICMWRTAPTNPIIIVASVFLIALGMVVMLRGGIGRRILLSALIGIGLVAYWTHLRYHGRVRVLVGMVVPLIIAILTINAYQSFRHATADSEGSGFQRGFERLMMFGKALATPEDSKTDIGSDAVDISLLAIDMYSVRRHYKQKPFNTITWVIVNPIPRRFWLNKPKALGATMPEDTGQVGTGGYVNWGPGLVGHGFHEGGYFFIIFYAALFAAFFRCLDELLLRQPNNPYLLTVIAVISGQIIGLPRGDQAVFLVEIAGGLFVCLVLFRLYRLVTGRTVSYRAAPAAA